MAKTKQLIERKGGPVTKKRKAEIFEQLKDLIEKGNIMGVTNQQLAKQFEVKRETIAGYLKEVYESIPTEDIKSIEIKLKTLFDKVLRVSQQMLSKANTAQEQERALKLILHATKEFTDFLERFGLKSKQAENINLQASVLTIDAKDISKQILSEIRSD